MGLEPAAICVALHRDQESLTGGFAEALTAAEKIRAFGVGAAGSIRGRGAG